MHVLCAGVEEAKSGQLRIRFAKVISFRFIQYISNSIICRQDRVHLGVHHSMTSDIDVQTEINGYSTRSGSHTPNIQTLGRRRHELYATWTKKTNKQLTLPSLTGIG